MEGKFKVGVAGHRSWIGRALIEATGAEVVAKGELGRRDLSDLDCLYLVLGRARPSEDEEQAERDQAFSAMFNCLQPRRTVYLSSQRLTGSKLACEDMVLSIRDGNVVLRPGAVFGPTQDLASGMLVPSLVREGGGLQLQTPDVPAEFVSLDDLVAHMARFADPLWWDQHRAGQPGSACVIPGSFVLTPRQVRGLFRAFDGLGARRAAVP